MVKEQLKIAEENIYNSLKKSFPSFITACRINGSRSPQDDAMDLQNDLFLKLRDHIYKPQNIKILVAQLNNVKMYYRKQKGRSEGIEEEENSLDIVQGKLLNFSVKNKTENTVSISIDTLSKSINNKEEENNIEYILNEIQIDDDGRKKPKNTELFLNNNSIKPNALHINVYPMEYSIQRSAKNLAIDKYSSKNTKNKTFIDIVIEPGKNIDAAEGSPGYKEKENEDSIIENIELQRQRKKLHEYMDNKMDPKMALALRYHMQGLSGGEIATLMEISHGNVRKLIYKSRLELTHAF